jgi:hypothetical protein
MTSSVDTVNSLHAKFLFWRSLEVAVLDTDYEALVLVTCVIILYGFMTILDKVASVLD